MRWALAAGLSIACSGGEAPVVEPAEPVVTAEVAPEAVVRPDPPEGAPNILFVSLDTVRADRLGAYGGRATTPALSALAARGTRFDQAMTHFPETCLSHWSMFTGILPEAHGNVPRFGESRYQGPTLATLARDKGYATGAFIGGYTLTDRYCGTGAGFDVYDDDVGTDRLDLKRPGTEVTAAATAWMAEQERPWLALVHYFDAHHPYTPAPPWDTAYTDPDYGGEVDGTAATMGHFDRRGTWPTDADVAQALALYDGELSELDTMLAPLLEAAGDDTIVVLTADHGESFGHEYWFNHAQSLYDEVLHVPLIIAGPGVPAGATVEGQVGLVDVLPTLGALSPLDVPGDLHGRDRSGLMRGDGPGLDEVFAVTDPWRNPAWFAVRTEDFKVIWHLRGAWVTTPNADPDEANLDLPVPVVLQDARERYEAELARVAPVLSVEPEGGRQVRQIAPEERARLEALGYVDPVAEGQGSPGKRGKGGKAGKRPPRR